MKKSSRLLPATLLVALSLTGAHCGPRPAEPALSSPRLVLLYATCTLNKHFLSPYEPSLAITPHLERFREGSMLFLRHQTESGQSGNAFASLFTGLQADGHGIYRHPTPLDPRTELIGEVFRRAGWEVVAWLEHGMASAELGYAQGADPAYDRKLVAEEDELHAVLERLRRNSRARALLITNFTVTHGPYQSGPVAAFCDLHPSLCDARADAAAFERYVDFYRRAHAFLSYDFPATRERTTMDDAHLAGLVRSIELLYRANVAYLDELFGAVVDEIRKAGLLEESVIVFTADHGETLYREGTYFKWTHGHQLAPEVLEVPLLIRAPGLPGGEWPGVTRSIDILPTLAGLAGVPLPDPGPLELPDALKARDLRGVDLSAALLGRAPPPVLRAFSHTSLIAEPVYESSRKWGLFRSHHPRIDPELMWHQLREGDLVWQLRPSPDGELRPSVFDLSSDPHTLHDLFDPQATEHRRGLRDLRLYRQRLIETWRRQSEHRMEIGPERQKELLESLSYID